MARRNLAALTSPSSSPSSAPWSQIFQVIFGRIFSNCLLHLHQYNYLHKNPHIFITNYWNIFTRFWILELQICCSVYSSLRVRLYAEYLVYDTICFSPLRLASCLVILGNVFQAHGECPASGYKQLDRGLLADLSFLSAPQVHLVAGQEPSG